MIRHLVERLSRNSAFRRRLPSAFGGRPVYLSGDSALSYLKPDWAKASASLLNAAAKYAAGAKCVWDIGSNCGVFAIAAAHVAGPNAEFLAIEPDLFWPRCCRSRPVTSRIATALSTSCAPP
jgi:hypothetical protein